MRTALIAIASMTVTLAASILAAGAAEARQAYPGFVVKECVAGERALGMSGDEFYPLTVMGDASPGHCRILMDEFVFAGEQVAPFEGIYRGFNPARPSASALAIAANRTLTPDQGEALRSLARQNPGDARIYATRYELQVTDSLILSHICGPNPNDHVCRTGTAEFHASANENNRRIDERNAAYAAEARASSSEPINSGYYQSGQYSRDVAASQGGYSAPSGSTSSSAPIAVQSETEIRRQQDQCRRGSGPC